MVSLGFMRCVACELGSRLPHLRVSHSPFEELTAHPSKQRPLRSLVCTMLRAAESQPTPLFPPLGLGAAILDLLYTPGCKNTWMLLAVGKVAVRQALSPCKWRMALTCFKVLRMGPHIVRVDWPGGWWLRRLGNSPSCILQNSVAVLRGLHGSDALFILVSLASGVAVLQPYGSAEDVIRDLFIET
jgi:hypothetical protein